MANKIPVKIVDNGGGQYRFAEFNTIDGDVVGVQFGGTGSTNASGARLNLNAAAEIGSGDIEITDSTKGIILTAPNSNRYRITVDNFGGLVVTAV